MISHPKSPTYAASKSLEDRPRVSSSNTQGSLFSLPAPGSLNDELMVRSVLTASIKRSGKSREVIGDEMTVLLGITVTARMITAFTAESKEFHRWPAAWDRAFCLVVGDTTLLVCRCELAGLHVITPEEKLLLDLGRAFLQQKQSADQIEAIHGLLNGRSL